MKEDVEAPPRPPVKRRQLEKALPVWLQLWANDESLRPAERRRARDEIDRRRGVAAATITRLGIVFGHEGISPAQKAVLVEAMNALDPATLVMASGTFVNLGKKIMGGREWHAALDHREVVRVASVVYCFAKAGSPDGVSYDMMRYAKHRKVSVHLFLYNGEESPLTKG